MYPNCVCRISSLSIEISLWICAIDKQPQLWDLVNCSTTTGWIATNICTSIDAFDSYKTSPKSCLCASWLLCCAPGGTSLTTCAYCLYHIGYRPGFLCFILSSLVQIGLQSCRVIREHMKAQEANQFENVYLICTISSSRITLYYTDLDKAQKSEHDTKRTITLCSETREELEMYLEMASTAWECA